MQSPVTPAGAQIPADPVAPVVLDFVSHALRVALVRAEDVPGMPSTEWDCPGVYVLIGSVERGEPTSIYVGKARILRKRLSQHRRKPPLKWWRAVAVARDTTNGFHSAEIGYLEGRLTKQLASLPGISLVAGQQDTDETLPEHQLVSLDAFVPTILAALRLAGLDVSPAPDNPTAKPTRKRSTNSTTIADLVAAGVLRAGETLIFDSRGRSAEALVNPAGEIVLYGTTYSSPSGAARAVLGGRASNGWKAWTVGADGPTLAVLRNRFNSD